MKRVLFTNSKIQTRKQIWANAVIMSEWNLINALNSDYNCEMNKINEQMKNKNCRNSVNKKHECEKVKKCECEHEKNKEWEQNERCECEHRERNSSIDIDDDDKKSENYQSFLFMQLILLMYSANSQHTTVSEFCAVLQITWVENFSNSKSKTINIWEKMTFYCNFKTCHLFDQIKTLF